MPSSASPTRYQRQNRLEDVLVLIQALGKTTNSTGQVSNSRLSGDDFRLRSQSASSWTEVAKEHPEFFRIAGEAEDAIMLVCQYVSKARPSDELLGKLMDLAVTTHDREAERTQRAQERELESQKMTLTRWSIIASTITALGSIAVAIVALVVKKG